MNEGPRLRRSHGYILWSGILCIKGVYACPAELTSNIKINLPGDLGRCLNLKWQVKNCTIMENYLKMVPAAGMMQKGEIFSKSWYFNICSLRPLDSKDRFSRIQDYFCKTESVSLVKSGEDILLIMSDRNFPESPGSSPERQNLHCIVLSKTSKLVRGQEMNVQSYSRIYPENEFLDKPPASSLLESNKLEESFNTSYEQQKNEIDMCDKHTQEKETKLEQSTSCKRDSHEDKRKASSRIEPKERKRHKTDNSLSDILSRDRSSSKTVVNMDTAESKRKRHKSEKIRRRKDVEIPHVNETKNLDVEPHVFKPSNCTGKTEGALISKITDPERSKSVESVIDPETSLIEKKDKTDSSKKRISEPLPDTSSLKKAKLLKVNETDDSPREQQDKKTSSKKKVPKISVMEKKQMESEKVLSTLNLSHCKENVRSLGRIPKKKSTTVRDTESSNLKLNPEKAISIKSADEKESHKDSCTSDAVKFSKGKNKHEKEKSEKERKKSFKDKERHGCQISVDATVSSSVDVKLHTSKKDSRQDYDSNKNHVPLDCVKNLRNKEENAQKQTLQDPSNNTDKKNKNLEHATSVKDGVRISQESELTYERDVREDLFMLDDSPRTKSLPALINVQDQLCRMKSRRNEALPPAPSKTEYEIPGFGDLDLLIDLERKQSKKTATRKIEKTEDGLLVMRNVKDTELGSWSRCLTFSDFISQTLHSFPKNGMSQRVDQCPFHKAVALIHQKTVASNCNRAITLDPSDPCIITITIDFVHGHKININSNLSLDQNISCKVKNDALIQDSPKLQEIEGAGTKIASNISVTRNGSRNETVLSSNMNMDKSFVLNEVNMENTLTNSAQVGNDGSEKHSADATSVQSGKVVDKNAKTDYMFQEQSGKDGEAVETDNFCEVTSEEDLCWNIAIKPVSKNSKQDCVPKVGQPKNKLETSKVMLKGKLADTMLKENQTRSSQVETNANTTTLTKGRNDKKVTIGDTDTVKMHVQPESKGDTIVGQKVCDKKLKDVGSKTKLIGNKPKTCKALLEQKVCDEKSKDCLAMKKQHGNHSDVRTVLQEKAWHTKIGDNMAKTKQTESEIKTTQIKSKVVVPGKEKKDKKDVHRQSKSKEEKIKKADDKKEKQENKIKVTSCNVVGDKKMKEGSIQQRLEKISEQTVPEEMKTKKNEKRQARQYHPYKKEPKPKRPERPTWSFEIAYSDMEELLLNLTENMFKIDGRSSADIRRWRKGTNKSGLCSGRGRFCGFRFNRSEIPDSLPKFTETVLLEDDKKDYRIGPELISSLEERARQADIVEESWQNELEEESGFIDEMCIYTQDKDQNVAVDSSYVKTDKKKTTLIIPGMGKSSLYSREDLGDAFPSTKELMQKKDLHRDKTELPTPSEDRDISSEKQIPRNVISRVKTENIAVKIECESHEKSNMEDDRKVATMKASNDMTDKSLSTNTIYDCSREKKMAETTNVNLTDSMKDVAKLSQPTAETRESGSFNKQEEEHDLEKKRDLNKSPDLREQKILSSDSEVCLDWTDDEILSESGVEETESDEGEEETFVVIDKLEDCHVDSSNDKKNELTESEQSLTLKDENFDKSEKVDDTLYQKIADCDKGNDRCTWDSSQKEEHESAYVYDPDLYHTLDEVAESDHSMVGNNEPEQANKTKSDILSDTIPLQNEENSTHLKGDIETKFSTDINDTLHSSFESTANLDKVSERPNEDKGDQKGKNNAVHCGSLVPKEESKVTVLDQLAQTQKTTTGCNTGDVIEVVKKDSSCSADCKTGDVTSNKQGFVSQVKHGSDPSLPLKVVITSDTAKNTGKEMKPDKISVDCDVRKDDSKLNLLKKEGCSQLVENVGTDCTSAGQVNHTYNKTCKITNTCVIDEKATKPIDIAASHFGTKQLKSTGKLQTETSEVTFSRSSTSAVNKDTKLASHIATKKHGCSSYSTSPKGSSRSPSVVTKTAGNPHNNQSGISPRFHHYHQYLRPFPWNTANQQTFSPNSQYPGYGLMYPSPPLPAGNLNYASPGYSHTQSTIQPYYSGMYNYQVPNYSQAHLNFSPPYYSQLPSPLLQLPQMNPLQTSNVGQSQNRNISPSNSYSGRYSK